MKPFSISDKIENILIAVTTAVVSILLTLAILEMTSIRALKQEIARQDQRIEKQDALIIELAKIEKYRIQNSFDKLKAKDGQIILSLDNKLAEISLDSISPKHIAESESFWDRLKFWQKE